MKRIKLKAFNIDFDTELFPSLSSKTRDKKKQKQFNIDSEYKWKHVHAKFVSRCDF